MKSRSKASDRRPPKKLKCLHVGALTAFNKVKKWVELNEPEHFGAFQPKNKKIKIVNHKMK